MSADPIGALELLREYGLAGFMAWLFWWTLRRMTASHDSTVRGLKEQLQSYAESLRLQGDKFAQIVQNHLAHASQALSRFETALEHSTGEQRRWQERLLRTLEAIDARLARKRGE